MYLNIVQFGVNKYEFPEIRFYAYKIVYDIAKVFYLRDLYIKGFIYFVYNKIQQQT